MSSYIPAGLSFRALTILVEHIEHDSCFPIIVNDQTRAICTTMLIRRGFLRPKNSRTTTITRKGHEMYLKAAAAWADLLARGQKIEDTLVPPGTADYGAAHEQTDIRESRVAARESVAAGQDNPLPEERTDAPG